MYKVINLFFVIIIFLFFFNVYNHYSSNKNIKNINLNRSNIEEIIKTSIEYETKNMDRSSGGRFSSKLIALEWAKIWVKISEKKMLREWCTSLYYGAKKEFSSKNGPFLKIY